MGRAASLRHRLWGTLSVAVFRRLPGRLRWWLVRHGTPRYTAGVLVLVTRPDGRVLLVRQRYRQEWFLPGGLLQRQESAEDAARRELREELGLLDASGLELGAPYQDSARHWITWHARLPLADGPADALVPTGPEITELWWCPLDEVPRDARAARRALHLG